MFCSVHTGTLDLLFPTNLEPSSGSRAGGRVRDVPPGQGSCKEPRRISSAVWQQNQHQFRLNEVWCTYRKQPSHSACSDCPSSLGSEADRSSRTRRDQQKKKNKHQMSHQSNKKLYLIKKKKNQVLNFIFSESLTVLHTSTHTQVHVKKMMANLYSRL